MTFEERKIAEFLDKFSYLEHPINYYLKEAYVKNDKKGIEHIYDIKDFLSTTLSEYKEELLGKIPEKFNLPDKPCINLESRLCGKCIDCEKNKARNEMIDQVIQIIKES